MIRRWAVVALGLSWAVLGAAPARADAGVQAPHHDMKVQLDPAAGELVVTDRVRLHGGGLTTFLLDQSLEITEFAVDGRGAEPARSGDRLRVRLGGAGEHVVVFQYKGRLSPLPEEMSRRKSPVAVADPRGSYLSDSVNWYPDLLEGGRFTYRIAVEAPEPQKVVVPGRLLEETTSGGRYRAIFASEAPDSGITLMAGPYVVEERLLDGIRLRTYFDPSIAALAKEYLDLTAGYIDLYRERIGDYPFAGFAIVSGPLPVGLGFAGMTYIGTMVLRLPFIRYSSLGHEILHNWWGNGVFVDYGAGNWAEGLTTFMADYAYAEDRSSAEAKLMRLSWLRNYAALPEERDRPVVEFVANRHQAAEVIGYNKVALFFHMLRADLGKDAFDAGLRRFWELWKFRTAGWKDLRQAFEQASGRGLDRFFGQWLRRAGALRLKLGPVEVARGEEGFRIVFTLAQDPPAYGLKVPVTVTTATGEERFTIALEGLEGHPRIVTEERPLALAVDPDFELFRRLDAAETPPILREVSLNGSTVAMIPAGDEAARKAARKLAERLMDVAPRFVATETGNLPSSPLLVIGTSNEVAAFLKAAGLPGVPESLAGRGTARVWAGRRDGGLPVAVVAANDADALKALLRPLPHYVRKGYLVFEGAKAAEFGLWPAGSGPLRVRLE